MTGTLLSECYFFCKNTMVEISLAVETLQRPLYQALYPPVDLHWFFEISIRTEKKILVRTEKKIQLVYTEILFQFLLNFFFSF